MALQIHDPGHIALRRGVRAAIAMPVVIALCLYAIDDDAGAVFAAFGTIGMLVTADYAGSWQRRLVSYLVTGVVGSVVIVVGVAASATVASAVVVTAVMAFALSFLALMRGMLAVGTPAVQLIYVVAVSIGGEPSAVPQYLSAWWIAVGVCVVAALAILPHDVRRDIRAALVDYFAAAARLSEATWRDGRPEEYDDRVLALRSALAAVDATYDGKPFRPTGAARRDRGLAMLVTHINTGELILAGSLAAPPDLASLPPLTGRDALVDALTAALLDLSRAMGDPSFVPSAAALEAARLQHAASTQAWVLQATRAGTDPEAIEEAMRTDHVLRIAGILAEQLIALARQANGAPDENLAQEPPIPQQPWSSVMRAHLSWDSPWLRTALRTGLGLSIAILIVKLTGVQHGFWVLLGVIAILRYDWAATRRNAVLAVIGTIAGVAVGTVLLLLVGDRVGILWVLLPISVFLVGWSTIALAYPISQAAFSLFILIVLGIINWPPHLDAGLVRIEDIALGAGVAAVVGMLMWPRGALGELHHTIATGLRQSSEYLALTMRSLTVPVSDEALQASRYAARAAAERTAETYDMAIMQRGSDSREARQWAVMTCATHMLLAVGRILASVRGDPPILLDRPELDAPVEQARAVSTRHWLDVAADVERSSDHVPPPPPAPVSPSLATASVVDEASAHAYVIAVWTIDWTDHMNRITVRVGDGDALG